MDGLIAEAASRGRISLELVSVDSTIVRAHQESSGLAVAGETLDALERRLDREKGGSVGGATARAAGHAPQVTSVARGVTGGGAATGDTVSR